MVSAEDWAVADASANIDALLRDVAGGDRRAFDRLYRLTSDTLFGICVRMLGDRREAEDLLQDIYVTVWKKAGQFDAARAPAMAWLSTVARNRAIDRLRGVSAGTVQAFPMTAEWVHDSAPTPADRVEIRSDLERLEDCVGQLDARGRELIRTAFFDGVTYQALAERAGQPIGSVKTWIRRGLLQLRACLEK